MAITKELLSGSTDGVGIKVVATATPGSTIHTATGTAGEKDEIYLYAMNTSTSDVKLTLEFGGQTDPDNTIEYTVPAEAGLQLIIPGFILQNSKVITAFAATGNVIMIYGYVNRIA